jgi:pantothenate synthetase
VLTVVAKLFGLAGPSRAFFGEKDAQQLALIRRMVVDLDLPVEIVACPTVREADGLALSSRNVRLSPEERAAAPVLCRALHAGEGLVRDGEESPRVVRDILLDVIAAEPLAVLDYAVVLDRDTWEEPDRIPGSCGCSSRLASARCGADRQRGRVTAGVPAERGQRGEISLCCSPSTPVTPRRSSACSGAPSCRCTGEARPGRIEPPTS